MAVRSTGLAVASEPDLAEGRRRRLVLTPQGRELAARLQPLWQTFEDVSEKLNAEAADVVALLDRLDTALAERSLLECIRALKPGLDGGRRA